MDSNVFYKIIDKLKTEAENQGFKTVTFGTADDVNLNKQDLFPIIHLFVPTATQSEKLTILTFELFAADVVDFIKDKPDSFYKDNTIDIFQDLIYKLQNIFKNLELKYKTEVYDELVGFDIIYNINYSSFKEKFENLLAGWTVILQVQIQNMDNIC